MAVDRHLGIAMLTVLALVMPAVVSSCSSTSKTVCAGQCSPPYRLDVFFHSGTSLATEQAIVTACTSRNPAVLGVRFGFYARTTRETVVKTSQIHTAQTKALIRCLEKAPSVVGAGYPA